MALGNRLAALRVAGEAFLDGLRPADQAALVAFGEDVVWLAESTPDKAAVRGALSRLRAGGATAVFDALYAGILLSAGELPPLVVLFTDGEDNTSWLGAADLKLVAERSNALVHVVGWRPSLAPEAPLLPPVETESEQERTLREIAEAAGGRYWNTHSPDRLRQAFAAIADAMGHRYVLRYEPTRVGGEGWHRIDARLRGVKGDRPCAPRLLACARRALDVAPAKARLEQPDRLVDVLARGDERRHEAHGARRRRTAAAGRCGRRASRPRRTSSFAGAFEARSWTSSMPIIMPLPRTSPMKAWRSISPRSRRREVAAHVVRVLHVAALDEVERRERRRAAERVAAEGVAVRALRPALHHALLRHHHPDRQARAEALGDGQDVGRYAPVLAGEHLPGAADAGLHLVRDQQDPVAVAERAQPRQEARQAGRCSRPRPGSARRARRRPRSAARRLRRARPRCTRARPGPGPRPRKAAGRGSDRARASRPAWWGRSPSAGCTCSR